MTDRRLERRIRGVRWAEPPGDLRARVLTAAPVLASAVTWSDRIWFSRAWRTAAVAAVIGAVGLEMYAGTPRLAREVSTETRAQAQEIEQAGRDAGLPADVAQSFARRTMSGERPAGDAPRSLAQALDMGGH